MTAPIVGMGRQKYLDDALAALSFELTDDEAAALEKHYTPRSVAGFR